MGVNYKIVLGIVAIIAIGLSFTMGVDKEPIDNGNKIQTQELAEVSDIEVKASVETNTTLNLPKKLPYTKVALPKEMREIADTLVDIQNDLMEDKYKLDLEASEALKDDGIEDEIAKAEQLIAKINEELDLPTQEIEEIESSYSVMMSAKITTPQAKAVYQDLLEVDEKVLEVDKAIEQLVNGDIE